MSRVLSREADGRVVRKAGVTAVVLLGGPLRAGDPIEIAKPPGPAEPLAPV